MHKKVIFSTCIQLFKAILMKEVLIHVYQHMTFYGLYLSLLVLHVKCTDKMPLKQFGSLQ